jgi:5S rRNA maturation endonuclease (ribonuclease M5)
LGENNLINKEVDWAQIEKQKFTSLFKQKERVIGDTRLTKDDVRSRLVIPSPYFLSRGFSKEILDKYDIGDCHTKGKPMNGRAVITVYDDDNFYMVGSTGRSIYGLCDKCNCYHAGNMGCPEVSLRNIYSKWKNNFDKSNFLYNQWFAKNEIKKCGSVILVESPGNVLRLEEAGIRNSVAIFGLTLSDTQRFLLNLSGATTIITIFDNDENEAGQKAAATIAEKLKRLYHVINYLPKQNDIAEMPINVVKEEILPILEKVC